MASKAAVTRVLARVQKLQSNRPYRDAHRAFVIEGVRQLVRALEAGFDFECVLFSDLLCTSAVARAQVRAIERMGVPVLKITPEVFRQFSKAERASGVAAIVQQRWVRLEARQTGVWVVLEELSSTGHLGTVMRSAAAFGANGLVFLGGSIEAFEPRVVRASMGAIFGLSMVRMHPDAFVRWSRDHVCSVVGASPDGTVNIAQLEPAQTVFLLLGEERQGLTAWQRDLCSSLVSIPMHGNTDSLNV
ncbi:MAG: TrmH family RNA methyltransferase, partial [Casimicrobium sp.]